MQARLEAVRSKCSTCCCIANCLALNCIAVAYSDRRLSEGSVMPNSIHEELRHRGEPLVEYPSAELWKVVGGGSGVTALVEDLYRRIEQDELLSEVFPHFNSKEATPFFMQWFGGSL